MDRGKIVAIITGVISIALAIAYLILVQLLDLRGPEMIPAPTSILPFVFYSGFHFSSRGDSRIAPTGFWLW
ncbi:MAG: hypothetical protein F6K22_26205 [Okeania sp. SIO2F4]|uniref:hypothetical protein n=1 Tax=Okeania sp. SIO2F4 TaxID=2607790 RepID=UPI001428FB2E|nr:hypothetical protein [Okeania sp. SIO2F4]NES05989.1 hypothetical protein [Okeania sp. SIO2F4]